MGPIEFLLKDPDVTEGILNVRVPELNVRQSLRR
jgi:hypothetical protein